MPETSNPLELYRKPENRPRFRNWLREQGAEVVGAKGVYEELRFEGGTGTGIIYKNGKGKPTKANPVAVAALIAFRDQKAWRGWRQPETP